MELAQKKLIDIRPKIGTYVSYIDSGLVEEIRHLRSVLEAELAVMACDLLSKDDIDKLWENIALWQLYIKRGDEEKISTMIRNFIRCSIRCVEGTTGASWWKG